MLKNRNTCNVGMVALDANVKTQLIFRAVSDFLCMYFYKPHLGVSRRLSLSQSKNKDNMSYNAFDYRIFLFKPNFCIADKPMSTEGSMLMIETDNGIFCRVTMDSRGSFRVEAQLNNLAVVVIKERSQCDRYSRRGLRGTSGSGRGVNTAVEFLCCSFAYHFDVSCNSIDVILSLHSASLRPSAPEKGNVSGDEEEFYDESFSQDNVFEDTEQPYVNLDAGNQCRSRLITFNYPPNPMILFIRIQNLSSLLRYLGVNQSVCSH